MPVFADTATPMRIRVFIPGVFQRRSDGVARFDIPDIVGKGLPTYVLVAMKPVFHSQG
jgi:hypothetical protein